MQYKRRFIEKMNALKFAARQLESRLPRVSSPTGKQIVFRCYRARQSRCAAVAETRKFRAWCVGETIPSRPTPFDLDSAIERRVEKRTCDRKVIILPLLFHQMVHLFDENNSPAENTWVEIDPVIPDKLFHY